MNRSPDVLLLEHYDRCLAEHGDTAQGADWPNETDRQLRFEVMLDVLARDPGREPVLCDLGCGTGELLAYLHAHGLRFRYIGVDRSARALAYARAKFPDAQFLQLDVNDPQADLSPLQCDYMVINGVFTVRSSLTQEQMWNFLRRTVENVWPVIRKGLAFNVMSKAVDWERDDLFHVSMDELAMFLHRIAGRRLRFRADYGMYEYTAYAFKDGCDVPSCVEDAPGHRVPVMRPRLPTADRLLPYLRRIDGSRIYSNFGPLAIEFENRLRTQLSLPEGTLVSASSGFAALVAAILGTAGRATAARPLALMPDYTFVATASAAEQCGFQPCVADIDAGDWMLSPETVLSHPQIDRIGVVIPVSPYGRRLPVSRWVEFQARTGIPVVIDGAACFDTLASDVASCTGTLPVALSFHATKSLGTGEGGCVICTDAAVLERIGRALNFGFQAVRDCRSPNTNGKMSEYHAAVGLAELDDWDAKIAGFRKVAERYRMRLAEAGLADRLHASPEIGANYVLFLCGSEGENERVRQSLDQHAIDFRLWYGLGLHRQTYYAGLPSQSLEVTESIAHRLIGLPCAPDLDDVAIDRVCAALCAAVQ